MDGESAAAATVTITVNAVNDVPTANAGDDSVVDPGDKVTLDGSESSDIEGDSLTFSWVQTAGLSVTLAGASTATPSFTAPQFEGGLTFELTVSDGPNSDSDSVTIYRRRYSSELRRVRLVSDLLEPQRRMKRLNRWYCRRRQVETGH